MRFNLGSPTILIGVGYTIFANLQGYTDLLGYFLVGVGVAWINKYVGDEK